MQRNAANALPGFRAPSLLADNGGYIPVLARWKRRVFRCEIADDGKRVRVLGEFFAADPAEVDSDLLDDGPTGRYPTVEAKTVDPVSISTLGEILGVGSYDELIDEVSEGAQAESGEAGLFTIPVRMRDALAAANLDTATVAAKWGRTEELSDWPAEEVEVVVRELAALAQRAERESLQLFFWWSL